MAPTILTLEQAFSHLRQQFLQPSHSHPGLKHFWVRTDKLVEDRLLQVIAQQCCGHPLVATTKWRRSDNGWDYSCLIGDAALLSTFMDLAPQAGYLFSRLPNRTHRSGADESYDPIVAWVADLYREAAGSQLQQYILAEWLNFQTRQMEVSLFSDVRELERMKARCSEPYAVHRFQMLVEDVFTASAAVIEALLERAQTDKAMKSAMTEEVGAPVGGARPTSAASLSDCPE